MSLRFESREFFEAEEFLDKLSDATDESEEFLDAQECSSEDSQIQNNNHESLLLHKLAFSGDIEGLVEKLKDCSEDDKTRLDKQGNTILHVGILRNNLDVLKVALDAGISAKVRNARGWSALDEAVATKRRILVEALYLYQMKEIKSEVQKAKASLIQTLQEMPDYSMELNWQLGSPVIGYVLRKFAPHDTYKIYKTGSKIRVDGTLMGIEKNSSSMIPEWKRGDFSLLYDGTHRQSRTYLAFHRTKEYLDLTEEKQEMKKNTTIETGVDLIMADGVGKTKLRATDLRFKPVKGWLSSQQTEKIEKWNTVVYEASAKMMAVTRLKSNLEIPSDCTFEQYLNMSISEDKIVETSVLPSSISSQGITKSPPSGKDSTGEKKIKPKKISGRCWMAEDFPMSLQQLLPLLDVVGHANKHLSRVSKFMRKYGDMNMFPVKIQVPLLLTVYLMLSFKKFKYSNNRKISMDLPKGYVRVKLEDVLSSAALGDLQDKREDPAAENKGVEALRLVDSNAIEY